MKFKPADLLTLIREAALAFGQDKAPRLAAAIAYYAIFSIAPLLVFAVAVAGFFLSDGAVIQQLFGQGSLIAQNLGLSLTEIERELSRLPLGRTPTAADWRRISNGVRGQIDAKIATLQKTRADLDGCIGCGCLSLRKCRLFNPGDSAAAGGSGPRVLR